MTKEMERAKNVLVALINLRMNFNRQNVPHVQLIIQRTELELLVSLNA